MSSAARLPPPNGISQTARRSDKRVQRLSLLRVIYARVPVVRSMAPMREIALRIANGDALQVGSLPSVVAPYLSHYAGPPVRQQDMSRKKNIQVEGRGKNEKVPCGALGTVQ